MGRSLKAIFGTNILIDHLRDVAAATDELQRYGSESKSISLITWIEVMAGATAANEGVTRGLLDEFLVFSVTEEIAERSAAIRRDRRMKLPDAIIWATAQIGGRVLVTRNTRDFPPDSISVHVPYVL
jgi:predicted nucleic acid-binding protein